MIRLVELVGKSGIRKFSFFFWVNVAQFERSWVRHLGI